MEIIDTGARIFKELGTVQSLIYALLLIVVGGGWYYLQTIYPKKMEAQEKREAERAAAEERKEKDRCEANGLLKESVNQQIALLSNNNKAIEHLGESIRLLNLTFEKVSDRLSSHDERSVHITSMLQAQNVSLASLAKKMPNNESLVRIHGRIDEMAKDTADKNDVNQICAAITKLDLNIGKVSEGIAELKGRSIT
jgi:tRNA A37 N6-isopentenylltransferase MiaA